MNFQVIYTFTYQKTLRHTTLLLVFRIIESLQGILKKTISLIPFHVAKYSNIRSS